jgi:hypothetical protein
MTNHDQFNILGKPIESLPIIKQTRMRFAAWALTLSMVSLLWVLSATTALAEFEQSVQVSLGSATGKTTYSNSDPTYSFLSGNLDHNTSGGSLAITYSRVLDSGLIFGGGYHDYSVSGQNAGYSKAGYCLTTSGATVPCTLTVSLRTDKFEISGIFGMVGYRLDFADAWSFRPQGRLGIGNSETFNYSGVATLSSPSATSVSAGLSKSVTDSGNMLVFVLPVYYRSNNILLGLEFQSLGQSLTYNSGTVSIKASLVSATVLTLGFLF